ncbi:uncharacterized protein LOC134463669 [Engraulis encrasicolus]|uniref:uncharacterized protein LOC134463669 n=1 Tax=Engraulis encrasicolus TaxID=184585 RepID=UPI002FD79A77
MTFAKLEDHVSVPENAEQLMEEFQRKLEDGEKAKIQNKLRNYGTPKTTLCFSTKDILQINKNQVVKKLGKDTGTEKINAKSVEPFIKRFFDKSRIVNKGKASLNTNIRPSPVLDNIEEDNSEKGDISGQSLPKHITENSDESKKEKEPSNSGHSTQLPALDNSDNIKQSREQGEGEHSGQNINDNIQNKDETNDEEPLSDITNMQTRSTNGRERVGEMNEISEGESKIVPGLKRPCDNQHSGSEPPSKVSKSASPQPARAVKSERVFKGAFKKYADDEGIPSQELKTWIKVINVKQHEKYPFLVADRCVILQPPPEARDQWPKAKLILADEKMIKTSKTGKQLTPDAKVKIQYEMGILGITETIVLFPDNTYMLCQYDHSKTNGTLGMYDETVCHCKNLVSKLLAPLIVIFKESQREKIVSKF